VASVVVAVCTAALPAQPAGAAAPAARLSAPMATASGGQTITTVPNPRYFGEVMPGETQIPLEVVVRAGSSSLPAPTVYNETITGPDAGDFYVSSNDCVGQVSACGIYIVFHADYVAGTHTASLLLYDDVPGSPQTVALSGLVSVAGVSLSSEQFDLGTVPIGTTSASQTLTLTSTGVGPLHIDQVFFDGNTDGRYTIESDTCTGQAIAPSGTCAISFGFNPFSPYPTHEDLWILDDAGPPCQIYPGSCQAARVMGAGVGPWVGFLIPYAYAGINVGTTRTANLGLTNLGNGDLDVYGVWITGPDAARFTITSQNCTTAPVPGDGGSCAVYVAAKPIAVTSYNASLVFSDNDTTLDVIPLTLRGVNASDSISTTKLDFGTVALQSTVSLPVTITSNGPDTLSVTTNDLSGPNASDFALVPNTCYWADVPPSSTCTITVAFSPRPSGGTTRSATLTVWDSVGSHTVSLTGKVAGPSFAFSANPLAFGSTLPGSPVTRSETVTNDGDSTLTILHLTPTQSDYTVTTDHCTNVTLNPGHSCSISITFDPCCNSPRPATLAIDAGLYSAGLELTGEGLAPYVPNVDLTFPDTVFGTTSAPQTITFANQGAAGWTINSITSPDTVNFAVVPGSDKCSGTTVPVGGTCSIAFVFSPTAPHHWESRLNVDSNAYLAVPPVIDGTGLSPWAGMAPTLSFGTVALTSSSTLAIPIRNIGTSSLHVTGVTFGTPGAGFSLFAQTCQDVPVSGACELDVRFAPAGSGPASSTMALVDDEFIGHSVTLSGGAPYVSYFNWYDLASPGMRADAIHLLNPSDAIADTTVTMPGAPAINVAVAAGKETSVSFGRGHIGGPVVVTSDEPIKASQRVQYFQSFNEVWALTAAQASDVSYIQWFDTVTPGMVADNIHLLNPGSMAATVTVTLGTLTQIVNVNPGQEAHTTFSGHHIGGPVKISSTQPILASQRVQYYQSFNEVVAHSAADAGLKSYFNWFDNASPGMAADNIHLLNPSATLTAHVTVSLGALSQVVTVDPGQEVHTTFSGHHIGGPVVISSDNPVLAEQRVQYFNSFNEVASEDASQAATTLHIMWFDTATPGMVGDNIHLLNPSASLTASVTVTLGTLTVNATVAPGAEVHVTFGAGHIGGPVTITSDNPVLAAQRVQYFQSFNEVPAT